MVIKFLNEKRINFNKKKTVHVSFESLGIGELDTLNEKFTAELIVKASWYSDEEDAINYDPKVHWNPKLYFDNALSIKDQQISYEVHLTEESSEFDCKIIEVRRVNAEFWEKFELEKFPLDSQKLSVIVTTKYSGKEISLVTDPDTPSIIRFEAPHLFRDRQKWHLFRLINVFESSNHSADKKNDFKRNYSNFPMKGDLAEIAEKTEHIKPPQIAVTFYTARRPGHIIYNGIFLILLITLMALPTFAIDMRIADKRIITLLTILLTSVTLKWVMNRLCPDVSKLTLLDKYSIVGIIYTCFVITWHALAHSFLTNGYPPEPIIEPGEALDRWFCGLFAVIWLIIQIVFFAKAMRAYSEVRDLYHKEDEYIARYEKMLLNNEIY